MVWQACAADTPLHKFYFILNFHILQSTCINLIHIAIKIHKFNTESIQELISVLATKYNLLEIPESGLNKQDKARFSSKGVALVFKHEVIYYSVSLFFNYLNHLN